MPRKPDLQFKSIEIPAAYIKIANALGDICLETVSNNGKSKNNFKNLFTSALVAFPDEAKIIKDEQGKIKNLTLAGFSFDDQGNVEFLLKYFISSEYFHLFNIDFYGQVTHEQFVQFLSFLNKHKQYVKDIHNWIKYRELVMKS